MGGVIGTVRATVPDRLAGERADRVVAVLAGLSRSEARRLVEGGEVKVDGAAVAPKARLAAGAAVVVEVPDPLPGLAPEPVPFTVVYEDERLAVVDKPAGVVVHPGAGHREGTLAAGLLERWPDLEGVGEADRWGIVHRLDRETSGLLVVAKEPETLRRLQGLLRRGKIQRTYLALVCGLFEIPTGTVDAPLGRDSRHPTRVAVRPDGRPARTHFRRLADWPPPEVTLLEVQLETGRTHQIRVHLRAIDHPVVGDVVYGRRLAHPIDPGRVWLHARRLTFPHPHEKEALSAEAPLPADLRASLTALGPPAAGTVPENSGEPGAAGLHGHER